ncbi:MAG: hypothetical protein ACQERT_11885 [Thermodesulfobacteriota bacterium]
MNTLYTAIQNQPGDAHGVPAPRKALSGRFQSALWAEQAQTAAAESEKKNPSLVHLGQLSAEDPTVSHLLVRNPDYTSDCWSIVHNSMNQTKSFRQLLPGQDVWLNPDTQEIILDGERQDSGHMDADIKNASRAPDRAPENDPFNGSSSDNSTKPPESPDYPARPTPADFLSPAFSFTDPTLEDKNQPQASSAFSLSQAVAAYRGQPYSSLDCYELVVQGLKDLGLKYSGQQGLQKALIQEAKANNLPLNALLTGEGLISSLGQPVAETSFTPEKDGVRQQAEKVLASWQDRLEPGMILSFSTRNRGHTGVLSSHQNQLTFINSGQIDNSIHPGENGQQVGEEDLLNELVNWMQRAAEEKSHLQITVGRLEKEKIAAYQSPASRKA